MVAPRMREALIIRALKIYSTQGINLLELHEIVGHIVFQYQTVHTSRNRNTLFLPSTNSKLTDYESVVLRKTLSNARL
jgi:hypothetical protein